MSAPRAVVLLSGGLDSTTAAAVARADGRELVALTIDYNQRHRIELDHAARVAATLGARRHVVLPLDLRRFGGSALTSDDIPVPTAPVGRSGEVPATYVPARNTIFLSLALALAEVEGAEHIYIGVNALDYSGYPDCRPEFIDAFERMAALATRAGLEGRSPRIHTPLIAMRKAEIIAVAGRLGVDLGGTWSCYDPTPQGLHCGRCESCQLRRRGFVEAGIPDPTRYAA